MTRYESHVENLVTEPTPYGARIVSGTYVYRDGHTVLRQEYRDRRKVGESVEIVG